MKFIHAAATKCLVLVAESRLHQAVSGRILTSVQAAWNPGAFESHKQPERRVLLHTVGHKNAAATMKVDIDSATRHNGDPGADVWLHDWLLLGTSS